VPSSSQPGQGVISAPFDGPRTGLAGSPSVLPEREALDCEILAIGTELLLGQVVDTNSAWMGERLASAGIPCYFQSRVGDNQARIAAALEVALSRAQAVICCGGLGPTPDDITREAIADVMGVELVRDASLEEMLERRFSGRELPASNYKQADVPRGCCPILPTLGTAPGLICPLGERVVYAVPGVPAEMREMVERAVVPDLHQRSGVTATIRSRFLRVWGVPESKVAEIVTPRLRALEAVGNPTIAFLASATEGVRVRVTARADLGPGAGSAMNSPAAEELARRMLDAEEANLRALLGDAVGGVDDEGLEVSIGRLLAGRGWRLAVAESLTGGMVASRLAGVPGASNWFDGGVVAYADAVKRGPLGVLADLVVSEQAAKEMAAGVARLMSAEVGLSLTGVAGPALQEDQPVGTVFVGICLPNLGLTGPTQVTGAVRLSLRGDRQLVRERAATSALDMLRRQLSHLSPRDA
jgi:nicotinamide-nucleotide amidase